MSLVLFSPHFDVFFPLLSENYVVHCPFHTERFFLAQVAWPHLYIILQGYTSPPSNSKVCVFRVSISASEAPRTPTDRRIRRIPLPFSSSTQRGGRRRCADVASTTRWLDICRMGGGHAPHGFCDMCPMAPAARTEGQTPPQMVGTHRFLFFRPDGVSGIGFGTAGGQHRVGGRLIFFKCATQWNPTNRRPLVSPLPRLPLLRFNSFPLLT